MIQLLIIGMRIGAMLAKFGLSIFIARFLGLESLGQHAVIVGIAVVVPSLANLGLLNTLARSIVTKGPDETARDLLHYWLLTSIIYFSGALVATAVAWCGALPLEFSLLVLSVTLLEHLNQDLYVIAVSRSRAAFANILFFIRAGLWPAIYVAAAYVSPDLRTIPSLLVFWIGGGLATILLFICYSKPTAWRSSLRHVTISVSWYREKYRQASRFLYTEIAIMSILYADRFMISAFLGLEAAGVYALFWQVGNAIYNLTLTGVIQVARPRLIEDYADGHLERYRTEFWLMVRQSLTSSAALSVLGGTTILLAMPIVSPDLMRHGQALLYVILAATLCRIVNDCMGCVLYSTRKDRQLMQTTIVLAVVATAVNLLGISTFRSVYVIPCVTIAGCLATAAVRWCLIGEHLTSEGAISDS